MLMVNFHNVLSGSLNVYDRTAAPRVHVDQFRAAIDKLSTRFGLVSFPELFSRLERGAIDDEAATLTFDDGYSGVLRHAFPILRDRGVVATVMVVTQALDSISTLLHFEELEVAFRISKARTLSLPGRRAQPIETNTDRVRCLIALKRQLKLQPEPVRRRQHHEILSCLRVTRDQVTEASRNFPVFDKLTSNELRFLASSGWTIGSHTRTHRTLSCLNDKDVMQELAGSRDDIQTHFDVADMPFAYPYGGPQHIGDRVPQSVKKCGYSCALTTTPGSMPWKWERFHLPRTNIEELDQPLAPTSGVARVAHDVQTEKIHDEP